MRFFRRTPATAENAGRMLSALAHHARIVAAKTEREKVKARARQLRHELGMPASKIFE